MQHQIENDNSETMHLPSFHFVCSVAHLLQSDPTELLRELGYYCPDSGTSLLIEAHMRQAAQEHVPGCSGYYLG